MANDDTADHSIPAPRDDDTEDVHWALTTAASLQAQGDHVEALRWLRRAVEAAAEASKDQRAVELGKRAADLAQALGGAPTHRGPLMAKDCSSQETMPISQPRMDDLDEPTYVDSRPPLDIAAQVVSRAAERRAEQPRGPMADPKDEITLIPGTKKAAGIESVIDAVRTTHASPASAAADTDRRPTSPAPPPVAGDYDPDYEGGEVTASMVLPPNIGDIVDEADRFEGPTMTSGTAIKPMRVALVQIFDGAGPRVLPLAPKEPAPPGSALALLVPASRKDASRVASMMGVDPKDGGDRRK
ncbi:MAG: hypothetical protein JRI68_16985 [Deltaproteobacteria bacterium]|nr:hypothetical protein [Deltaproteobacteria bacterium]